MPSHPLPDIHINPPQRMLHRGLWRPWKKKAILCLVYDWSLKAERYVSPEEHFLLWNLIAVVVDRKWERGFHFPVAIFAHKLNKDPFATAPLPPPPLNCIHLPLRLWEEGTSPVMRQCNLHHEFNIHGKMLKKQNGVKSSERETRRLFRMVIIICFFGWWGVGRGLQSWLERRMEVLISCEDALVIDITTKWQKKSCWIVSAHHLVAASWEAHQPPSTPTPPPARSLSAVSVLFSPFHTNLSVRMGGQCSCVYSVMECTSFPLTSPT